MVIQYRSKGHKHRHKINRPNGPYLEHSFLGNYEWVQKDRVFVPAKYFNPTQM